MLKQRVMACVEPEKAKLAFVIKNMKTGETAEHNAEARVSSASLIKIPIMAEVMRQAEEGGLSLKQRVTVKEKDKVPYSILTLLETDNTYSLCDLITLMIIQSDNTATNLLIDIAGLDNINMFITEMRLRHTILQRKMMDFAAREAGLDNYTAARDMAQMMEMLYNRKLVSAAASSAMLDIMKNQLDNTMLRLDIPDDTVVAHKTGELNCLNHEAGIVYQDSGDYIFTVFVWEAVTNNFARQTIGRISRVVYDYFRG